MRKLCHRQSSGDVHRNVYDAVVVGLGAVGSFALRALARMEDGQTQSTKKFLGVEQYKAGHNYGSSHGYSRIYRRAYFEHPSYVPWIDYSLKQFRRLEYDCNVNLMQKCGCLLLQPMPENTFQSQSDVNLAQLPRIIRSGLSSALEHDILVEVLSTTQLRDRFPQFNYDDPVHRDLVGLYEPDAGFIRPELAISSALDDASSAAEAAIADNHIKAANGPVVNVLENMCVAHIKDDPDAGVVHVTLRRSLTACNNRDDSMEYEEKVITRHLLLSGGAWMFQLVPSWKPHLRVTRQIQGWIDVSQSETVNPSIYDATSMPAWVMSTPALPLPAYGVPCDAGFQVNELGHKVDIRHWMKIGIHGRTVPVIDPSDNTLNPVNPREMAELQLTTARALNPDVWRSNQYSLPCYVSMMPCFYTMTADTHFMIGTPAEFASKRVFAIAGLSGHGFKMAPALGQMMADFVYHGPDFVSNHWKTHEICSPVRFDV
jgi:sarcosine oxidase